MSGFEMNSGFQNLNKQRNGFQLFCAYSHLIFGKDRLTLFTLLSCGLTFKPNSQSSVSVVEDDTTKDIDLYFTTLTNNNLMQGSVFLMREGEILFQNAYGITRCQVYDGVCIKPFV